MCIRDSLWHHEHTFEETENGTLVKDKVIYKPIGGALVHKLFVRRDLEKIFRYRQEKIAEIFAAMPTQTPVVHEVV